MVKSVRVENAAAYIPDGPGFGIELDDDKVEKLIELQEIFRMVEDAVVNSPKLGIVAAAGRGTGARFYGRVSGLFCGITCGYE